ARQWIAQGNAIFAIGAVIAQWIYTKNGTPDFVLVCRKKRIAVFHTAAIPYANVQETIIFTTRFCKRVKGNFLYTVNTAHHVCPEQLTAASRKTISCRIFYFPFRYHPLYCSFNGIIKTKFGFRCARRFGMRGIKETVFCKVGMKGETAQPGSQSRLVDKPGSQFNDIHVEHRLPILYFIQFAVKVIHK